eukprot:gene4989-34769_t
MFEELKSDDRQEVISDAGSEEDEAIPLYEDPPSGKDEANGNEVYVEQANQGDGASAASGEPDALQLLLDDTPLRRLRRKNKEAEEVAKAYAELKCYAQTGEHCNMAITSTPESGVSERVAGMKREVNLLMGETLLTCSTPKPLIALEHFAAAAGARSSDDVTDPAIKVLISQSHAMIGDAKLGDAKAAREACLQVETRIAALKAKLNNLPSRSMDRSSMHITIDQKTNDLADESAYERKLLDETKFALDKAVDTLTDVAFEEEERLKKVLQEDGHKKHPLLISLFTRCSELLHRLATVEGLRGNTHRRCSEMLLRLATVEGLRGNTDAEVAHLQNIMSIQRNYNFLPLGVVSMALKETGAVYVVRKKYVSRGGMKLWRPMTS